MKKIVYIDMDGVLCDYKSGYKKGLEDDPRQPYPQSKYGFYMNLEPIKDSIVAMYELKKTNKFDLYILTAPSIYNVHSYSEKRYWVEKNLGFDFCDRLIISPHKHLNLGHYLIDDDKSGKGQDQFVGELIHFGSDKFPDWSAVVKYLKKDMNLM